jgi:hypothetical protein
VGLEGGPLSLATTIQELLERRSSGSGLGNRDNGHTDYETPLYPQKWALTSQPSGGRSVSVVRLRTQATEFVLFVCFFRFCTTEKFYHTNAD